MDNKQKKELIGKRIIEIVESARKKNIYAGEIVCPNCDQDAHAINTIDGSMETICPNCGYDSLGLDWTNINQPLPWPGTLP